MSWTSISRIACAVSVLATLTAWTDIAGAQSTLIRGARVFDGTRVLGIRDVLVTGGRIVSVGKRISAPAGAAVVDASGKTLIPGFIDAHAHAFGDALEQAVVFGVTTELDMFTDASEAAKLRAAQKSANVPNRADIFSAGTLVTAPKGHGTEYGMVIPTISSPDSAQAFVDARISEGSDYIKIVYDDGRAYGMKIPTVSLPTLRAVIAAAHKRGKLAVVHIGDAASAREAITAGADGLVHLFVDRDPDPDFGPLVAARKAFVIPTMTVNRSVSGVSGAGDMLRDSALSQYLSTAGRGSLMATFPFGPSSTPRKYSAVEATVKQLLAAGVPILAGTDAPNPGTGHGIAMHRELELLVKAGLSPVQALAAATSAPAKAFSLRDRGRIAPGLRADLVLVAGDPTTDITATQKIEAVWKGGARFDRASYAAAMSKILAAQNDPGNALSGPVSDFDDGSAKSRFGMGWLVSTDKMAGGKSSAEMNVVDGGANGTAKSLGVTGTVVGPLPYAWAGVMFMPGTQPMRPANLSKAKAIRFWAKGDGKTYRLMLFSQSKGMTPITREFIATPEWKEHEFTFASFDGIDGRDILGIGFTGGPLPGTFSMQIDQVELQ